MTTTQMMAQDQIAANVQTLMLCDALAHDYERQYNRDGYEFYPETGRKYHKIIMNANGSRSVHAFVDKKTGEVYKSCLLYTSPSPRDLSTSRMPSSA